MTKTVAQLYDEHAGREWQRGERHRTEFAVTLRATAEFLPPPPARILDIGGGPGRHAIALAKRGYQVTLLDLSLGNLRLAQRKGKEAGVGLTAVSQTNAIHLPLPTGADFDAVLLLGPLYHLLEAADRRKAVQEARRVLRPGGVLLAAFITRFAPLRNMATKDPAWILEKPERLEQILATGRHPAQPDGRHPDFYFARVEEIRPFMENVGFKTAVIIGCEGILGGHEVQVNALSGELWQAWVDLNYRLGREPTLHGAADHLLYVGVNENDGF